MSEQDDFLVELGTEELPPVALMRLSKAFKDGVVAGLAKAGLAHGDVESFATPRRLALNVQALAARQPEQAQERRGPAVKAAFDGDGNPTKAAQGFARSCGVDVANLERLETDAGSWLVHRSVSPSVPAAELLPGIVSDSLGKLPIPKRMRWGDNTQEFVRPVRWLVMLHGYEVVEGEILGARAGAVTRGHRFHCPDPITLSHSSEYVEALRQPGHVIASFAERRDLINQQVEAVASEIGGTVVIDPSLLDEVTALTEWPAALAGSFEERFLQVPAQALIATMKSNQKYFHVVDAQGALTPNFIAVANLESTNPDSVRHGNERVVRPRLADAEFFFNTDLKTPLADRLESLDSVVFQRALGSVADKSRRVSSLAQAIAAEMGVDEETTAHAARAGLLCKCDLVTDMVGEFPELQGTMGARYARESGEPEGVAQALGEVYLPRFAGDALPTSAAGMALAVADRLDTLTGIFGIGQPPSGDKDPFALRRAALGLLRIIIEGELNVDLLALATQAAGAHAKDFDADKLGAEVFDFMLDRLRSYYAEQGISAQVYSAVHALRPTKPLDFDQRIRAVDHFRTLPAAQALAGANKRIANILRQADGDTDANLATDLLVEPAEIELAAQVVALTPNVLNRLEANDYTGALTALAALREPVDGFFDTVRVMDDDDAVRANRIALLSNIGDLFGRTADISKLQDQ
jgi:glycyl-tRNA synthetase beta chain